MKKIHQIIILLFIIFQINLFAQNKVDFTAETILKEEIQFSEVNKKGPTLVNFWALWCKPCRAEMKHLELLYNEYKEKGFTVIGINQDSPRSLAKVKSFIATHNISYPIITDPNNELFQEFNGQSIPLSILYDKSGKEVYTHVGYLPGDENKIAEEVKKIFRNNN